ncbi:hypothetical protein bcgnr5378_08440 [Bacillus cereus]
MRLKTTVTNNFKGIISIEWCYTLEYYAIPYKTPQEKTALSSHDNIVSILRGNMFVGVVLNL